MANSATRIVVFCAAALIFHPAVAQEAETPPAVEAPTPQTPAAAVSLRSVVPVGPVGDDEAQATAVALNYCRASFHRIRKVQSRRVLVEEREKILNNLNLNRIADEEVVRLYTAVLAEIADIEMAAQERVVIKEKYARTFRREFVLQAWDLSNQLAEMRYIEAVKTGVRSWWDFRDMRWKQDYDQWQLDKKRMTAVVDKSSLFLDTFWKLARKRTIPDRWLVRDADLERLEIAVREEDPVVRLRVLRRMERFMECYPPYWYYTARTQQNLGLLEEATASYAKLFEVGGSHFRKDEMLAAGLANMAVIQEFLKHPGAEETAALALEHATDVWEVNLLCAGVLESHGKTPAAVDAVLRNLDMDLELENSVNTLLAVHAHALDVKGVESRLADPQTVQALRIPVLLQCARVVGIERIPRPAASRIASSLSAHASLEFGRDDFVVLTEPAWQLHRANIAAQLGRVVLNRPKLERERDHDRLEFPDCMEIGSPLKSPSSALAATLTLHWPELQGVKVHLRRVQRAARPSSDNPVEMLFASNRKHSSLPQHAGAISITAIDVGDVRLVFFPELRTERMRPPTTLEPAPPAEMESSDASSEPAPSSGRSDAGKNRLPLVAPF